MNTSQMAAIAYLGKLPDYKIVHNKTYVILMHYGYYGWSSGGPYQTWEDICTYHYK